MRRTRQIRALRHHLTTPGNAERNMRPARERLAASIATLVAGSARALAPTIRLARSAARMPRWAVLALLLLGGLVSLTGARTLPARSPAHASAAAPRAQTHPAYPYAPGAPGGPDFHHWVDPDVGTTYSVFVRQSKNVPQGAFLFTLPDGTTIEGGIASNYLDPLQQSPDGSFVQQSACGDGVADLGLLIPPSGSGPAAGQILSAATLEKTTHAQEIAYVLRARLDATGLLAYATLDFLLPGQGSAAPLCTEAAPYPLKVQAGCYLAQCLDANQTATHDNQGYEDAVLKAATDGSPKAWSYTYPLTSNFVQGQYNHDPAKYGAVMAAQEQSVGRINKITATGAPVLQLDVATQPFCSVTQDVTVVGHGQPRVYHIVSYYILEDYQWRFWFSTGA